MKERWRSAHKDGLYVGTKNFRKGSGPSLCLFPLIHCETVKQHCIFMTRFPVGGVASSALEQVVLAFKADCEIFRNFERTLLNTDTIQLYKLISKSVFLPKGDLAPEGTFSNVWRGLLVVTTGGTTSV